MNKLLWKCNKRGKVRREKPIKRSTLYGSRQVNCVSDYFHTLIEFANTLSCRLCYRGRFTLNEMYRETAWGGGRGEKKWNVLCLPLVTTLSEHAISRRCAMRLCFICSLYSAWAQRPAGNLHYHQVAFLKGNLMVVGLVCWRREKTLLFTFNVQRDARCQDPACANPQSALCCSCAKLHWTSNILNNKTKCNVKNTHTHTRLRSVCSICQ